MRYIIDQDTKTNGKSIIVFWKIYYCINGKSIIVFWKIYYCITSVKPIVSALASH